MILLIGAQIKSLVEEILQKLAYLKRFGAIAIIEKIGRELKVAWV